MIELWHGGNRWIGGPEIRPARQGQYECGPGIYLTTSYLRARKYASGGKVTTRVVLRDDISWLEQARLPLRELADYVRTAPRLPGRARILRDVLERIPEPGQDLDSLCDVSRMVNLLINGDALAGKPGVHLASWLASRGIDASLHAAMGAEQWVIVFNPEAIKSHRVIASKEVLLTDYELPRIPRPAKVIEERS